MDARFVPFLLILIGCELVNQSDSDTANMASTSLDMREQLLNHNVLCFLETLCESPFDARFSAHFAPQTPHAQFASLFRTISWAICNFCRLGRHHTARGLSLLKCVDFVLKQSNDEKCFSESDRADIAYNVSWALAALLENDEFDIEHPLLNFMNARGITRSLTQMLKLSQCQRPALKVLGAILRTGTDTYVSFLIGCDILSLLRALLNENEDTQVLQETCEAIGSVAAGNAPAVVDAQVLPVVLRLLTVPALNASVAKEALWALYNAVSEASAAYLVEMGLFEALRQFLERAVVSDGESHSDSQRKQLRVALKCVEAVFEFDDEMNARFVSELEASGLVQHVLMRLVARDDVDEGLYCRVMRIVGVCSDHNGA